MNTTFSQTAPLDFGNLGEHEVQVDYTYSAGRPGKMYMPNGDPGYPDEPAEAEILQLIEERKAARTAKNFARADEIRKGLDARGVAIKDNPAGGTSWEYK
jgi:cysteinyl-tRNA synthetase